MAGISVGVIVGVVLLIAVVIGISVVIFFRYQHYVHENTAVREIGKNEERKWEG